MAGESGAGRKSSTEMFEDLIRKMPTTWTLFRELHKTSRMSQHELSTYLGEAKKKKLVESKKIYSPNNGRLCYWRRL